MKRKFTLLVLLSIALCANIVAQETPVFTKNGPKAANINHVGDVWLQGVNKPDSIFMFGTTIAIFDAGARLNWHMHPGGQILIVTDGVGYYQERGKPKQILQRGEFVQCQPEVEHWHGASPDVGVTYLSTSPSQNGGTVWLEPITDEEYYGDTSKK